MADLTGQFFNTTNPGAFSGTALGTAAGTTTIMQEPGFLKGVLVTQRVASGQVIIFDSVGTSGTSLGTIIMGTQGFSDPPALYEFDVATRNALSVSYSANMGITVLYK